MKKLLVLMVMLFLGMTLLMSQAISEYTFATSTDGSLESMALGTTPLLATGTYYDDNASAVTNIGFTFTFGGTAYTQFSINSNGQMQLGGTVISTFPGFALNTVLLQPLAGDNAIMATGQVHYKVVGASPNRILVVEWTGFRIPYASTGTGSVMQVWLHETSNVVKYIYGAMYANAATSQAVCISTSNVEGSVGNVTTINVTPTYITTGTTEVTTAWILGDMPNLNSAADGSRRVFSWTPPVATAPPNPAVLVAPSDGSWTYTNQVLSWASGGGLPDAYDVYFDTIDASTLVSDNQLGTTYAPTLAAGTTYYWKIVPSNSFGDATGCPTWSFKTPTATQLVESFESTTFPPVGWANPGTWTRSTSYPKHGVATAYKYGSSTAQYVLSGPKLTIDGTSTLNFWSACTSISGILQVVWSPDRVTWTQVGTDILRPTAYTQYESTVDLSSLAGNNYYIGFRTGLFAASHYIDRVFGPEITAEAPDPVTLTLPVDLAIDVNETTTFTWSASITGGVPSGYRVYCDTNPTPTTLVADVTGLTATLATPLAYSTTYYWTVEAYNAIGNAATPTPFSFTTRDDPTITAFPWTEDFEDTSPSRPNWTQIQEISNHVWTYATGAGHGTITTAHGGIMNARFTGSSGGPHVTKLVSPPLALAPATDYRVNFWYGQEIWPGDQNELRVYYRTDSGSAWVQIGEYLLNTPVWTEDTIILPSPSATYQIAFEGTDLYGYSNVLDDVLVEAIPPNPVFDLEPITWNFNTVLMNQTATKDFTILNDGGGTLNVSSIVTTDLYYSVTVDPSPVALTAGQSAVFTVEYAPLAEGNHTGNVVITDDRAIVNVPLTGDSFDATIYVGDLPYIQDFDTVTPPAIPLEWSTKVTDTSGNGYVQTYSTSAHSAPNRVGFYNSYDLASDLILISPPIDPALNTLRTKFWAYGSGYTLEVGTVDVPGQSAVFTLHQSIVLTGSYAEYSVDFSTYVGTDQFIAFRHGQGGSYRTIYFDDARIEALPTTPVFEYSPDTIDFGQVMQNITAGPVNVTITNTGIGTLNVAAADISIIGAQADQFAFDPVNLPAALTTGQSVIVPVTMTATSEGPQTATLRIVNPGARTDYDVALSGVGAPAGTVVIGSGTTELQLPIEPYYGYSYSQTIYLQSEINQADQRIEKIYYWWNGYEYADVSDEWIVYMGHTTETAFATPTSWIPLANLDVVYANPVITSTTAGWVEIVLDTPFTYNNVDNLVIAVEENQSGYDSNNSYYYCTADAANRSLLYYSDSINPNPAAPPLGTLKLGYPNTMLIFGDLPTVPILTVNPEIIWDFGAVTVGQTATKQFTVSNTGTGPLTISAIEISGDYYSLAGLPALPLVLDVAGTPSATFTVEYAPLVVGTHLGQVTITDNLGARDVTTVDLTGEGALVVNMATGSTTLGAGESYLFYDSGGPAAGYQNSEDYIYTFFPPAGYAVQVDFASFDVETSFDGMYIHDGDDENAPLIATYTGNVAIPHTEANNTGALTFVWHSDTSVTYPGWEATISLYSIMVPPDPAVLVSPTDTAPGILASTLLEWDSGGGVPTGYRVYLDTVTPPLTLTGEQGDDFIDPVLTINTTYYWYVVAYNSYGDAPDSPIWSFTTSDGVPTQLTPADAATDVIPGNINFSWTDAGAASYKIKIGTTPGGNDVVDMQPVVTTSYLYVGPLDVSTTYYWTVYSIFEDATEVACVAGWSFTTGDGVPVLVGPTDAAIDLNILALSFSWSDAGAASYTFKLGTTTGGNDVLETTATSPFLLPVTLEYSTTYYWSVISEFPGSRVSIPSAEWTFTTRSDPTIYVFPYVMDFEVWPPLDWDLTGGTNSFVQYTDAVPNAWARANWWGQPPSETDIMTTPPVMTTVPLSLSYKWSHQYHTSYPEDSLAVMISTDLINWTVLQYLYGPVDFESGDGAAYTTPGTGVTVQFDIPGAYVGTPFYIQFYGYSGYGPDLFIDDVSLFETPLTIDAPVISIAPDGTISWPAVAGAGSYKIYGSDDPYAALPWTELDSITGTSWLDPAFPGILRFYYVVADTGARITNSFQLDGLNNGQPASRKP